ncbi:MAG: hypothetical protein RLY21_2053 [Planctomycetota bacterium]|jgi:hypothetical protein
MQRGPFNPEGDFALCRGLALLAILLGIGRVSSAQLVPVNDAVSREVAVRVDPSAAGQTVEMVRDAVSREVAVRIDPTLGQQTLQLVRDAVSLEYAVRVEPTLGLQTNQLVRDSVSREFQIYVNTTDANGNGIPDLLESTAQTVNFFASSVPGTGSAWRDEGEAAGDPGCGDSCPCNSQFEPYAYNGGPGIAPDDAYLVANFGNIQIPANRVISSVVADVMCRFNDGSSGAVDLRVSVGGQQLLLATQSFTSNTGCTYRFGGAGRVLTPPTGGWTPAALANLTAAVRRAGGNSTTLRVTAFRLTVTTVERDTDGDGYSDSIDNCPTVSNPLQQDCDGNGIGDACELLKYPERDANMNGVIDACEDVAGWIGSAAGSFNDPANWSSGRVPGPGTAIYLRQPQGASASITISAPVQVRSLVVAGGTVRLTLGATCTVSDLFTVSSGAALIVDGSGATRTLALAGYSQVRAGAKLEIGTRAIVRALEGGTFAAERLSNLTFQLRAATDVPLSLLGASALRGGIAVRLGEFTTGGLELGTRFTLIDALNLSTGLYSALTAQGLETKFLKIVAEDQSLVGSLVLEVSDLQEFVKSAGSANSSLGFGEEPTAIVARNFTRAFDAFDDIAVTVRSTGPGGTQLPGSLYVFMGNGSGGSSAQATYATQLEPIAVESEDVTGDGRFDIVVLNRVSGSLQVFRNGNDTVSGFELSDTKSVDVGSTYLALSPLFNAATAKAMAAGFAFLASNPSGGTIRPGKIVGGTVTPFPTIPVPTSPGPVSPIDDTGRQEGAFMATRSAPAGDEYGAVFKVQVFGNGLSVPGASAPGPGQPLAVETGKLNDDAFADMVVAGLSSAEFGSVPSVSVYPGAASGFDSGGAIPMTNRPLGLAIGDFDADGKQDFAVALGTEVGGAEQGEFVRRFNNVTEGASNPVFESGANDVLFDGQGVRRIRRADLDATGPDDYAVLGDTITSLNFNAGSEQRGFAGGRVFELTTEPACPGDVDGDGAVNGNDLALLLASWGGDGAADFDGSDVVDGTDLTVVLSNWGNCGAVN